MLLQSLAQLEELFALVPHILVPAIAVGDVPRGLGGIRATGLRGFRDPNGVEATHESLQLTRTLFSMVQQLASHLIMRRVARGLRRQRRWRAARWCRPARGSRDIVRRRGERAGAGAGR
jgi:hypothetical protein